MNALRIGSLVLFMVVMLAAFNWQPAQAAWTSNPSENTLVTDGELIYDPQIVGDGAGGVIIIWGDDRLGGDTNIYAQRLNADGDELWTTNGVSICSALSHQYDCAVISDGAGGAIISWLDYRSGSLEIYAQRVDGSSSGLWATDGILVCSNSGSPTGSPCMTADGAGGAIIAWADGRNGVGNSDIFAQRVDGTGSVQWIVDGMSVCTASNGQGGPRVASDGTGGAVITWTDARTSSFDIDIYAQRVDSSGNALWAGNGVVVCSAEDYQGNPRLVGDGVGGAIIAWSDLRTAFYLDIFAQRLDASGTALWTADGIAVCATADNQEKVELTEDGAGGAIITWRDNRSGSGSNIYAQRVDGDGTALWMADGIAVCPESSSQGDPQLMNDGSGGAIIVWEDGRSPYQTDLYAQRIDTWGNLFWPDDGVAVSLALNNQTIPVLVSDGSGGAIIAWKDSRSDYSSEIYAQHLDWGGRRADEAWSQDPSVNNHVCQSPESDKGPQLVSDNRGGTIIAWGKDDASSGWDIYAQRMDSTGSPLWPESGAAICTATGSQWSLDLVGDGSGGAIITWDDARNGTHSDIFAQRVDSSGKVQWTTDGILVCGAAENQVRPHLVSDGSGGAIIVWEDDSPASGYDIYAQRVDSSGTPLWTADGVEICRANNYQYEFQVISDGSGGAIIAWEDYRSGSTADIYAQRVDASGSVLWPVNGVDVCTTTVTGYYLDLKMVSDGDQGAIITWHDNLSGDLDIYAQRMTSTGDKGWPWAGMPICEESNDQEYKAMVSDGAGGAIIAWEDLRFGPESKIYIQRVNPSGQTLWATGGIPASSASGFQVLCRLAENGTGGAYISWMDGGQIYVNNLGGTGAFIWDTTGVLVKSAAGSLDYPHIINNGSYDAIITWSDLRTGNWDIYAQRVDYHGYCGDPSPVIRSVRDFPNDQGGTTIISWMPGGYDEFPLQVISHYSVWMRQPDDSRDCSDEDVGLVPPSRESLERAGWVYLDDVPAIHHAEYGYHAPTYQDYTGGPDFPLNEYKVTAHVPGPFVFWESNVVSGCSVDNLAPGAPLTLLGLPDESDVLLTWEASGEDDEDLAHYNVYRGSTTGFVADESTLVGTVNDIEYTDPDPGYGTWYYRVAGEDVHGNVGSPSNEAAAPVSTSTVAASLTCMPSSGILPFTTGFTVQLTNQYPGQIRRIAGRMHMTLANGRYYASWRAGFTNIHPGITFTKSWNQTFPAVGTLVGDNLFRLVAADVTPSPWNQPPYPPAGDTDSDTATFTGMAP